MAGVDVDTLEGKGAGDPNIEDTQQYISVTEVDNYDFMDHAFHGSEGFRSGEYLVPHSREMFYEKRRDLNFFKNFVKPIIRAMIEPVFVKPVKRKVEPDNEMFSSFLVDCDNAETDLQDYTEDVITTGRLHGLVFTIVENFPNEEQPRTKVEAQNERKYPYVYTRTAQQVEDWELDKFGNLLWIVFCEQCHVNDKGKEEKRYRLWDATKTQLLKENKSRKNRKDTDPPEKKYTIIEETTHGLGRLPVIVTYMVRRADREELLVDPPLYDIARLNLAIYNKDSEIRDLERAQGFSILYVQTEGGKNLTVGPHNVIMVPMDAKMGPGYINANPGVLAELTSNGKELREDLFRIAEQNGVVGVQRQQSGIAARWQFYAHESILQKTSRGATILEEKIADLFMAYTNTSFVYTVSYPMEFQPNDVLGQLKSLDQYLLMGPPPKGKALAMEKATRTTFADEDGDKVQEIVDEIEEHVDDVKNSGGGDGDDDDDTVGDE